MQAEWNKPRLALQQADRVFANSRFTSDLVQRVGVDPKKIDIVHPGCDIDRFRPNEPRVDLRRKLLGPRYLDQIIITVGALVPRKGHDMVIRALRRLRQTIPNVTYVIVGDGPRRTQLEQLAEVVGVADRVVFTGKISDKDLLDTYALSDVFVMPSREELEKCDVEGFGLVFLEANACGKPVIGGRSGGSADAIIDGVTGLLVDPHDPEDIANAMQRVLSDRNLAIRLGRQGQLRVTSDFSWQQIASRVQQILDSIVNRDESRRMD
jgi:phosphatidylinositol alpha-1,6-mannosyltransferase